MVPDLIGTVLGVGSVLLLYLLYKYSDDLSDGNIERKNK